MKEIIYLMALSISLKLLLDAEFQAKKDFVQRLLSFCGISNLRFS